jgi:hypothetical protein
MDTTEQDVVKPEDGEPSGNGKGPGAAKKEPRSFFADQIFSIAAASVLVMAVVWASYKWGYHTQASKQVKEVHVEMSVPASVFIPLFIVFAVGLVASLWGVGREMIFFSTVHNASEDQEEDQEEAKGKEFKPLPEWLLQLLVYVLTGTVVFALIRLVALTGGFAESPFNELMTAPAVVGAFMAFWKWTPVQLMVVGIISVVLSIMVVDSSSPHMVDPSLWVEGVPRDRLHEPIPLVAGSWVFGLIASAMLILAGGLSYFRHTRKPPKSPEHPPLSAILKRGLRSLLDEAE